MRKNQVTLDSPYLRIPAKTCTPPPQFCSFPPSSRHNSIVFSLFSPPIRNGYVVLPSLKAKGRLYCCPFFFTTQQRLCSLHFFTTTTILSLPFLHRSSTTLSRLHGLLLSIITSTISVVVLPFHRTAPIMLSSLLRHCHHPHNFWSSFLHTRRLMLFFTAATTILSSSFLAHQPTTVTGVLSSLFHRLNHNFIVVFPSLPHCHGYLVYPPSPHRHGFVVFSSPPPS